MQTITIDILNSKAIRLLEDLESLELIRMRKEKSETPLVEWEAKYKGLIIKQPLSEIDKQLNELRNEWE